MAVTTNKLLYQQECSKERVSPVQVHWHKQVWRLERHTLTDGQTMVQKMIPKWQSAYTADVTRNNTRAISRPLTEID